jgi:hypothetical protein
MHLAQLIAGFHDAHVEGISFQPTVRFCQSLIRFPPVPGIPGLKYTCQ